jgi:hypothetical protein
MKNLKTLKSKTLLLALALSASSAFAQGKVEFDWVGSQNLFQASLVMDNSLVYPGSVFWPGADQPWTPLPVIATGLNVTGPNGSSWPDGTLTSNLAPPGNDMYSHFDGWGILRVYAWGGSFHFGDVGASAEINGVSYYEAGYWVKAVPEPSAAALLGLGVLALYMKRAASR